MKLKTLALLAMLIMLWAVAGCGRQTGTAPLVVAGAPVTTPATVVAADHTAAGPDIPLVIMVPYASREMGFSGVMPAGWAEFSPGHFQPARPGTVPTLFGQSTLPGATIEEITGAAADFRSGGRLETAGLTWGLYTREFEVPGEAMITMEYGLAEANGSFYVALLASQADQHEALRETLLLPALEALRPLPVSEDAGEMEPQATALPPLTVAPAPVNTRIRSADGMVMVYVPAGDFQMGQDGVWSWMGSISDGTLGLQGLTDQRPQHAVYLDGFWIDQTQVTVSMFRSFVQATGYETTAEREGYGHPYKAGPKEQEWPQVEGADWQHPQGPRSTAEDDHPVVQVSWDDAAAYCSWAGGMLPTEAQWEKGCRGTDARVYPWGSEFDERRLNYCDAQCPVERWSDPNYDDGYPYTSPVGSYPEGVSPYGAMDMAGNVWEWTADRYDSRYYATSPRENPRGSETGVKRVQHGGAWYDGGPSGWLTCTIRHATVPHNTADDLGFRCAVPAREDTSP